MKTITINTTTEDVVAIDQVARNVPLATRHAVARAAFRLGLTQMTSDRRLAVEQLVAQHEARKTG